MRCQMSDLLIICLSLIFGAVGVVSLWLVLQYRFDVRELEQKRKDSSWEEQSLKRSAE